MEILEVWGGSDQNTWRHEGGSKTTDPQHDVAKKNTKLAHEQTQLAFQALAMPKFTQAFVLCSRSNGEISQLQAQLSNILLQSVTPHC